MSVLIKGMEMPESCCTCVAGYGGFCFVAPPESDGVCPPRYERPDWCPLVELPSKHGRLIDCDALVEIESTQYSNVMKDGQRDWFEKIIADLIHKTLEVTLTEKNAPTVLESEDEDND